MATVDNILILNGSFTSIIVNGVRKYMLFTNVQFTFRLAIIRKGKGKGKVVPVHAKKTCGDFGCNFTKF